MPPYKLDRHQPALNDSWKVWSPPTWPRLQVNNLITTISAPGAPTINYLQDILQSRWITASKCMSKLAQSWPQSASPNSLDHGLQGHLLAHLITASQYIAMFPRSWCGETLELEYTEPITDMLPHLSCYLKGLWEIEQLCLEESRKRVRGCGGVPSCEEPHKVHRCHKACKSAWGTNQVVWIYESSGRVCRTKSWERVYGTKCWER